MYTKDDIDLLYILEPHGWSTCILYIGKQLLRLSITHVFGDPIRDFIEATNLLPKGNLDTEFIWWDEPGEHRWNLKRQNDQHHKVRVTITEFLSCYGDPISDEETVAEFEIKISHFATLVYLQM